MLDGRVIVLSDYAGGGGGAASGGAGLAVLDSYRALRGAGVDARLVTGFGDPPPIELDHYTSLAGHDLRAGGAADTARAIYHGRAGAAVATALAHEDPRTTVVMLHQWTRFLSPAAMRPLKRFALMIYMHDYFWACPNGAYYDFNQRRPCRRMPLRTACLSADCDRGGRAMKLGRVARAVALKAAAGPGDRRLFLHLSDHARRVATPLLSGERHATIHNPIELPDEPPSPVREPSFDIGYVGRLEPEKGVDLLAQAAAATGRAALFVGQGSLAEAIATLPGVTVRPWVPRPDIAAAMRSCRAIALPSRWDETWGLVIPEAMAAGVPVLVSARAGSSELVRRFGGGLIFDPDIPGDLTATLDLLLAEPVTIKDWAGLRRFLAPRTHADRVIALAAETFGVSLARPMVGAPAPA